MTNAVLVTPAWPFDIDWTNGFLETLEWKTVILTAANGGEQRYAARVGPRRRLDVSFVLSGQDRAYFDMLMMHFGGVPWYVPLAQDAVSLGAPLTTGQTTFAFDTTYREYRVGGHVLLRDSEITSKWEVLEIASVTDTGITTTNGMVNAYPNGCRISPAVLAQITDVVTVSRLTSRVFTGTVQFSVMEATYWPVAGRAASGFDVLDMNNTGNPYPVITVEPNSVDSLDYAYQRTLRTIDGDVGLPHYTDVPARGFLGQKYTWFLAGAKARSDFRDLLMALDGQRVPVWMPTFTDDVTPGSGTYPNPGLHMLAQAGRDTAMVFYRDGTTEIRTILPASTGDAPLPDLDSAAVLRVSFLNLKRLNQDSVEILHQTDANGLATVSATFLDAPDLRIAASPARAPYTADFNVLQADGSSIPAVNAVSDLTTPVTLTGPAGG